MQEKDLRTLDNPSSFFLKMNKINIENVTYTVS